MKTTTITSSYIIIVTGSFLFCAKGILVKELYKYGFNASEVLTLRMIFAFPFYLVAGLWLMRSLVKVRPIDMLWIFLFSFIGFFLCSFVNFIGLEHISVGLERIILFSYPSLVLIGGTLFQGQKYSKAQYLSCVFTWVGLALVVADEVSFSSEQGRILYGAFMVFLSALIYAAYLLCAKPVIQRVGAENSTTIGMILSCIIVFAYYFSQNGVELSGEFTSTTIGYALGIGILGTVAPTYLMSYGLSRVSSSSHAVVSSLGPIITILLVTLMNQNIPSLTQGVGMTIAITASMFTNLKTT